MSAEALSLIKEAKRTKSKSLYLGPYGFTEIPKEIFELVWLETLDISRSQISDASFLSQLTQLKELVINYNQISDASFLSQLTQLQKLDIRDNQISDASFLSQLTQLQKLDIRDNQISDASFLSQLTQLQKLAISHNQISDTSFLSQLTQLHTLDIRNNQISDASFLSQLTQLKELVISDNQISDTSFLSQLTQLHTLDIRNNQISDASFLSQLTQLKELVISDNHISDFAPLLPLVKAGLEVKMKHDYEWFGIYIQDNPWSSPPIEILAQGNEAILRYFEEKEKGAQKIFETRILIVGQGGAGKTTLRKKLKDSNAEMPENKDTTRGVVIEKLKSLKPEIENFSLNIWDFGGQNIQHYAHQFFLSGSSVYILVHNQREQNTNFQYWLNIIEMLGKSSPVLILQNEIEGHSEAIRNGSSIKERFPNVLTPFHQVDLSKAATDKRFDSFKSFLINTASSKEHLPLFGKEYPSSFIKTQKKLEEISATNQFINISEFKKITKKFGVSNPDLIQDYLRTFTILGHCLHFENDIELKNYVFLRPKWIIDALFELLYHPIVIKQNGHFSELDTLQIWEVNIYDQMQAKLLRLMVNFELCYPIEGSEQKEYILPQRLPLAETSILWRKEGSLRLTYKYKFMPKGIITRITCRLHRFISREQVWADSVIIQIKNSKAFIRERYAEEEIWIDVKGKYRSALLNTIVLEIDKIHQKSRFENLKVEKLIPCLCDTCQNSEDPQLFDVDILQKLLLNHESHERCNKTLRTQNIQEILTTYFEHENSISIQLKEVLKKTNKIADGNQKIIRQIDKHEEYFIEIINSLTAAEKEEKSKIEKIINKLDENNLNQNSILIQKIEESVSNLKKELKDEELNKLERMEKKINNASNPKHKLKLCLNFLFLKYETEYDGIAFLKEIKNDFLNGHIFLKPD